MDWTHRQRGTAAGRSFRGGGSRLPRAKGRCRGVTLIEVLLVLLVLGILFVAAIVHMGRSNARAIIEADALRSVLRYAQSRAMADIHTWGVSLSSSGYALFTNNDNQTPLLPGQGGNTHAMPDGVSLSGASSIAFDWRGQPVSVSGATPALVGDYQYIYVTESGQSTRITITPQTGFVP